MRTVACVSLLLFLLCGQVSAQSGLDPTDNQFWTEVRLAVPLSNDIDVDVLGTLRLGRDFSHTVDERLGMGFTFRLGKHVAISPNYLHIATQPFQNRRAWENRLSLPVTVRFDIHGFRVSDRNMFERRFRHPGNTSSRYRNRLQVEHPVGPSEWNFSLAAADEVFYDGSIDRWVRNRVAVGAIKVFNKHFTQEFYYLRQYDGVSLPGDMNVIGTTLRFRL